MTGSAAPALPMVQPDRRLAGANPWAKATVKAGLLWAPNLLPSVVWAQSPEARRAAADHKDNT